VTDLPAHSPLGGSAAERFLNCFGSTQLIASLGLGASDDSEYAAEGTRAHEVGAKCLEKRVDAWELMDDKVSAEMTEAVQVYLDTVRPLMVKAAGVRIERKFHRPDLHKDYYGTADLALYFAEDKTLDITDYKHGIGIVVEVDENPQLMYYAYGLLDVYPGVEWVKLRIVQPRGFHPAGRVREWQCSVDHLRSWAAATLLPAMQRAEFDNQLSAGEWCRFCPAKLVCPLMTGLFGAAATHDPQRIVDTSDAALGRQYQHTKAVKFYLKALEDEIKKRLELGRDVEDCKLVAAKANRVWKDGAEEIVKARIGAEAYTVPELKSVAEIEKISTDAKALVKEWAYVPSRGTSVALASDKRPAITVRTAADAFGTAIEKLEAA
jgi:hypothetical protein